MSISAYYKKRAKKIFPLYYGYILACVLVLWWLGRLDEIINPSLFYYFFLVPGLPFAMGNGIVPLVHLWFIGTIVLFYAVFPLFSKLREDSQRKVAFGIMVGWAWLKWLLYLVVGKETVVYRFVSVTSYDCLFLGVLLGLLWKRRNSVVARMGENQVIAIVVWGLFLLSYLYGDYVPAPVRIEYMACLGGLLILNQVSSRPVLSMENKVLNWLGSISYEIYVVQILVIMLLSMLYTHAGWQWPSLIVFLVCTVAVICAAIIIKMPARFIMKTEEKSFSRRKHNPARG